MVRACQSPQPLSGGPCLADLYPTPSLLHDGAVEAWLSTHASALLAAWPCRRLSQHSLCEMSAASLASQGPAAQRAPSQLLVKGCGKVHAQGLAQER